MLKEELTFECEECVQTLTEEGQLRLSQIKTLYLEHPEDFFLLIRCRYSAESLVEPCFCCARMRTIEIENDGRRAAGTFAPLFYIASLET